MKIRHIHASDMKNLLDLEEICHVAPWSEEVFKRCFEVNYTGYCLDNENQLIGFIIYSLQAGECHILNICIHPTYQGQGLGKKLLLFSLEKAKDSHADIVFLEVRRSNEKAIALYDHTGFIQIGERKKYYPSNDGFEDALVFALDLKSFQIHN